MSKKTRKKSPKTPSRKPAEDIGQKVRPRGRPHGCKDVSQKIGQETGDSIAQGPIEKVKSAGAAKVRSAGRRGIEGRQREVDARNSNRQEACLRPSRLVERGRQSARLPIAARRRKAA